MSPFKKIRLKLYADECFPVTSSTHLKSRSVSIIHAYERNEINKGDSFYFKKSKKLNRTLITLDRDFLQYEDSFLKGHPGVIIISVGTASAPNINKICDIALPKLTPNYVNESIVRVTKNKIKKFKGGKRYEKRLGRK